MYNKAEQIRILDKIMNKLSVLLFVFVAIPGLAIATTLDRHDQSTDDLFELSIEELMEVPIVVSGSRKDQKITETSVPIRF